MALTRVLYPAVHSALSIVTDADSMTDSKVAVDFVQEKFLGQGQQSNESALEQAKDEQISDFIRSKYKDTTGSDFPIADKVCLCCCNFQFYHVFD